MEYRYDRHVPSDLLTGLVGFVANTFGFGRTKKGKSPPVVVVSPPPPPPPPPPPVLEDEMSTFSIGAISAVLEGNSGTTLMIFPVTRVGGLSFAGKVDWAVTGSGPNPADASDFVGAVLPSGTVDFSAGQSAANITVQVAGDTTLETDEGFTVSLTNPRTVGALGTATAAGVILNDEAASDTTPDAFAFTDVTNAALSTVETSNTITVAGLGSGVSVAVSISGGTYSKNGGGYTSSAGTAQNGDTFAVQHTSSASNSTATNTTLTIGGVSDTYTSTTLPVTGAVPTPTGVARFMSKDDGTGVEVLTPTVGDIVWLDPGPFSDGPFTQFDYTILADGVAYETGTFTAALDQQFVVYDDLQGATLQLKCTATNTNGVSLTTSDSTVTSAVVDIDVSNAITDFHRTSSSGTTPATFSISFGANARAGTDSLIGFNVYSDASKTTQTDSNQREMTDADFTGPIDIDALVTYAATSYIEAFYMRTSPGGVAHFFAYPNAVPITDPAIYSKYRLYITKTISEFWSGIRDFQIYDLTGTERTRDSGVVFSQSVASGGAFGTVANAFDGTSASPTTTTAWEVGFDGPNYPHTLEADFTSATPFAAGSYSFIGEDGGTLKTWKFQGWNGSAWVDLDDKVEQSLSANTRYTFTL